MPDEHVTNKLDAYLDGELSPTEATALSAHLRECSACAANALGRVQLKRAVQMGGRRYPPSAPFREKIMKSVAPRQITLRWGWAVAFAVLLLVVSGAVVSYVARQELRAAHVYSELADLHVTTLASATPVDVVSTDRHTVKPWFQGRIPFTFNLPDLATSQFVLVGGRVAYLGQTPGAQLIYQVRKHEISVFIFQARGVSGSGLDSGVRNRLSFNVETWEVNGLRYFVIGDTGADDLRALGELLKAAARS